MSAPALHAPRAERGHADEHPTHDVLVATALAGGSGPRGNEADISAAPGPMHYGDPTEQVEADGHESFLAVKRIR